ncbi:PQQ-like beta-propeller repeat protein [candidate division FCPU426 bacterium]|nr:PQQ-like beta-propeller repeat protein [candidate division FCPU426 bacterium]
MKNKNLFPFISPIMVVACLAAAGSVWAAEFNWNRWKGPDQNGISKEVEWDATALNKPLKVNWKKNIGPGYSNVAIQGQYLYTMGYDKKEKQNTIYCLDVKTGEEIWRHSLRATKGQYEGPKSTPVVDDGRVYTFSQDGDMLCQDAQTGKAIWKKQALRDYGAEVLQWSLASSFLIEGDTAYLNACTTGLALNKKTGQVIWKSEPGKGNYATPVSFMANGKKLLAVCGQTNVYAVSAETGKVAWSFSWPSRYNIIAADPVIFGNRLFMSTGYGNGCALYDFSAGKPQEVWRNKEVSTHIATAMPIDGYLYAVDGNAGTNAKIECLDTKTGAVQWSEELGFGNMIAAGGYLIFINEHGSLYILKANPRAYTLVSFKEGVLGSTCWTAPVLCNANLYVKNNKGDLVSLNLAK